MLKLESEFLLEAMCVLHAPSLRVLLTVDAVTVIVAFHVLSFLLLLLLFFFLLPLLTLHLQFEKKMEDCVSDRWFCEEIE